MNTPAIGTKVPGRPRPAEAALADWREERRKWIETRADPEGAAVMAPFFYGEAEHMHRWRVQFDCGHVREIVTHSASKPPAEIEWRPTDTGLVVLPGQYVCTVKGCYEGRSRIRDVVSWDRREDELVPPDPEEPPEMWQDNPETWAELRHAEPRANWAVTLSCGHPHHEYAPLDWQPADGFHQPRHPGDEPVDHDDAEVAEREQRMIDHARETGDEYGLRYITEGFPYPTPFADCSHCINVRQITAQQYVGPLVPPPPGPPTRADRRAALQARLATAERQAAKLRKQLDDLDPGKDSSELT
jgi:hypothetical protein